MLHSRYPILVGIGLILSIPIWVQAEETQLQKSFSENLESTVTSGFDQTGVTLLGVGSLTAAILSQYDNSVRDDLGNNQKIPTQWSKIGDVLGTGIPGLTLALIQLQFSPRVGRAHIEALTTTFLSTFALKATFGRTRPSGQNRLSLPSGHTSTAFATATVMHEAYGWKVGIPSYLLAGYVALTRISDDKHWLSDTIAGATLGIFWGRSASLRHLKFRPIVSQGTFGVGYFYSF